jgi:hypothetical protein
VSIKYRRTDPNGDYVFGSNQQSFLAGVDAVSQAVKTRLKLLKGEWWEDENEGLPLFQNILGQPGTPQNMQSADLLIQDVITNTPDVIAIKDFRGIYDNRLYSVNCMIDTKYGEIQLEVAL